MILDTIVAQKKREIAAQKKICSLPVVKKQAESLAGTQRNFVAALTSTDDHPALIAELKRASPSAGEINMSVDLIVQAKRYEVAGAAAVSVVTDATFFAGNIRSIAQVKKVIALPILHKDFIIDEYQVYESVCAGADAILLIAALLPKKEVCTLSELALRLGLAPLIEVHTHEDVVKAHATRAKLIGINVRDLKTFSVLKDRVDELVPFVSSERIRIAESGIQTHADVLKVVSIGAQAILVGTALMRAADPGVKIRELLYGY